MRRKSTRALQEGAIRQHSVLVPALGHTFAVSSMCTGCRRLRNEPLLGIEVILGPMLAAAPNPTTTVQPSTSRPEPTHGVPSKDM
jgi:hypothetical protein